MIAPAQTYPQLAVQVAACAWPAADLTLLRRSYDLAALLFAARVRGSGKPFVDHLVGTASCLVLDDAPAELVAAALLHAAYEQGDFGDRRSGPTERHRARLRTEVGPAVEAIVAAYHALGWDRDVAARLGGAPEALDPTTRAALRVRLANEVDEARDAGLVLSGKDALLGAAAVPTDVVLALVERVGGPAFVACTRATLTAPAPVIPRELVLGGGWSAVRLPASARPRAAVTAEALLRRTVRRLPAPVRQLRVARRVGAAPSAPSS